MPKYSSSTLLVALTLCATLHAGSPAENLTRKSDDWFRSDDGRKALANILSWQSQHGDWPKNEDTTRKPYSGDRSKLQGTFDNSATTGELRALARAWKLTGESRYREAVVKGLDHILNGQYANGGWPQYFPLRKGYYSHITFNDNCMVRILQFLDDTTDGDDFVFLDPVRVAAAKRAIERGVDCIVKCQVIIDGVPTVWCAQHDAVTLAPAKARSYELPSLSGGESASILKYLMAIDDPSPAVIRAVHAGAAWYEASKITGYRLQKSDTLPSLIEDQDARPLWARFYELQTNRPFFCDRDGIVKYSVDEIGSERRNGYSWYGHWGESMANDYRKWPHR